MGAGTTFFVSRSLWGGNVSGLQIVALKVKRKTQAYAWVFHRIESAD